MEKPSDEFKLAYVVIALPQEAELAATLDTLDLRLSERSRFVPALLTLAGQEMSGSQLTQKIVEEIDTFVRRSGTAGNPTRQTEILKRMIRRTPEYLSIFIPEGEILDVTVAMFMKYTDKLEIFEQPETSDVTRNSTQKSVPSLPKDIKTVLRTPEGLRTDKQNGRLDSYIRKFGGQAVDQFMKSAGTKSPRQERLDRQSKSGRLAQPPPRDLARLWSEHSRQTES